MDYVVRLAPCPVLLVKEGIHLVHTPFFQRVLVPTNGSQASKRACQLACSLLKPDDETLVVLNVVEAPASLRGERVVGRQQGYAEQNVEELSQLARAYGITAETEVRVSQEPGSEILASTSHLRADLMILGISVRAGTDRVFLGPRVERILRDSPVPIIVVNS